MSSTGTGTSILGSISHFEVNYDDLKFENEVGHGAFGVVYKGQLNGNEVAIKVMKSLGPKEIEEFVSEIKVMMALKPNTHVVQLIGVCTDPSKSLCIITEFLGMGSLFNYFSKNLLPDVLLNSICVGIANGVTHLHKDNIIHRDLAARNILLTSDLVPKVADFGLSRVTQNIQQSNQTKTETGPLKWMAPECIMSKTYSTKSDVWAFGIVMVECMTRNEPYADLEPVAAATQVCMGSLMPDIPLKEREANPLYDDLYKVVLWCCQKDVSSRPHMVDVYTHLCEVRRQYFGY